MASAIVSMKNMLMRTAALSANCQSGVWKQPASIPDTSLASCVCLGDVGNNIGTIGCSCDPVCPSGFNLISKAYSGLQSNSHYGNRVWTGICYRTP